MCIGYVWPRVWRVQKHGSAVVAHALQQAHQLAHETAEAGLERGTANGEGLVVVAERDVS